MKIANDMQDIYTPEIVARHDRRNDLWMTLSGDVYDLTEFLKEHPGGEEVLLDLAGQDGTKCFNDVGHSTEALLRREKYKIGKLVKIDGDEMTYQMYKADESTGKDAYNRDDWQSQESKTQEMNRLLPWLILAGAFIIYFIMLPIILS